MMTNAKIGVALVGGYLLGRTKKAKMAIGLGLFLAGKKLNLDPRQLGTLVANSPVLAPLNDQVRKELVDATKSAAGAALTQRMNGLADSLHERTLALDEGGTGGTGRAADDRDAEPEDEPRDEAAADGEAADSPDAEREKPAARRRTSAKSSADSATKKATKSASATKSTAGDRSATARRTASSTAKASGKAASSRGRTSTAPGRKAASGARKATGKASGAARTAADQGGRRA
ncbi:hypothetical protein AB0G60_10450 [Streptomyces angustmyceticus]|uniref:DNA primase n=1 Tax=Streptomyces angustmyceticus TaxID=285578 RepID=A0A5J4LEN7_9ACTN|nr:hypothetical protein [Streptomyces angustmyceticus]UAL70714.1 hypothetical protein K7396_32535 [Streptomyces angustmyceticus]GES29980.1 hypothetical protein San01_24670 [Streptomyces angustmyceticus]